MKLNVGTKVILKSKHGSIDRMKKSAVYKLLQNRNQKYAYITKVEDDYYVVSESMDVAGDFYDENDVEIDLNELRKNKLEKLNSL